MPIKFPKSFGRRKSTDQVLEEVENTPEPSFRVFEQPAGGSKSLDTGNRLKIFSGTRPGVGPNGKGNKNRGFLEGERVISNRGSGASNTNSASTGGYYDNSSSSARLSSSSTLPSSTDAQTPEEASFPRSQKPLPTVPIPPIPQTKPAFSLSAAGRTFSFGAKAPKPVLPAPPGSPRAAGAQYQSPHNGDSGHTSARDRAMTESSYASTTTPPKLDFGTSDMDGFGNMFEGFGKRKSTLMESSEPKTPVPPTPPSPLSPTTLTRPPKTYSNSRLSHAAPPPLPMPMNSKDVESSPYSWGSRNSNDGLMSSPGNDEGPSTPRHGNIRALTPTSTASVQTPSNGLLGGPRPHRPTDGGLKRSSAYGIRRPSVPIEDEDAKLVMDSVNATRQLNRQSAMGGPKGHADRFRDRDNAWDRMTSSPSDNSAGVKSSNQSSGSSSGGVSSPVGVFDGESPDPAGRLSGKAGLERALEPAKLSPRQAQDDTLFDPAIASSAKLAAQFEEHLNSPESQAEQKKVMTPAQFERYRQQQETKSKFEASKSDTSDDDDDGYDDEDEAERNRQAAKQRKKQEAHLTVYRQQMMKVTGEQSSSFPNLGQMHSGPNVAASSSAPNLLSGGLSSINLSGDKDEGKESDDSDEDIPLAILAAHGFPNKNRPPSMLATANSNSNPRALSQLGPYPPPPRSVAGESVAAGSTTGKLPVFARNLPRDPYFGAGLVNPSNRESLAFSHNGGGSVYGGPSGPPPSGLPPGGLVGVIASEERSRAMRRGSPNSAAFNRSGSPGGGLLGMGTGAGMGPQGMGGIGGVGPMGPMPGMNMGMGMGMGMGGIGGMPMMPSGDPYQLQMSQQMTQLMQMQVQWMEKMMQMQQFQSGQQPPPQLSPQTGIGNSFLGVPGQTGGPLLMDNNNVPQIHQRTMSMLDPGSSQWSSPTNFRNSTYAPSINTRTPGNPGYTPSIAPSERSTVGLPSRYRPVSQNPVAAPSARASTFTSGTLSTWQEKRATLSQTKIQHAKGAAEKPDEDDDEGWEEMKKKREKKKSHWKIKNDSHVLKELFFSGGD